MRAQSSSDDAPGDRTNQETPLARMAHVHIICQKNNNVVQTTENVIRHRGSDMYPEDAMFPC